jgi:hypothetical protein
VSGVPFVIWLMFAANAALLLVNVKWANKNAELDDNLIARNRLLKQLEDLLFEHAQDHEEGEK